MEVGKLGRRLGLGLGALVLLALAPAPEVPVADAAQSGDVEALHDFRVAIRRLRSLLRAYQDLTDAAIPRRLRRGLRALARATNASRDLEVKLAWLEAEKASLKPRERTGERPRPGGARHPRPRGSEEGGAEVHRAR